MAAAVVIHTTDGGSTWPPQGSGTINDLFGVDLLDASTGWTVDLAGVVFNATNVGATSSPQASPGLNTEVGGLEFGKPASGSDRKPD